jgi:hypothetical protein
MSHRSKPSTPVETAAPSQRVPERRAAVRQEQLPSRLHVPGFVVDADVGLGDLFKRITYAVGVQPCRGCERRAAALNRTLVFSARAK